MYNSQRRKWKRALTENNILFGMPGIPFDANDAIDSHMVLPKKTDMIRMT